MKRLFEKDSLANLLTKRFNALHDTLRQILPEQFIISRDDEISAHVLGKLAMDPIVLCFDQASAEELESKVDVTSSPQHNPFQDRGPIFARTLGFRMSIPYQGDGTLFDWRPNPWSFARIRAEVAKDVVVIEAQDYAHVSGDDLVHALNRTKAELIQCLAYQAAQIGTHNGSLRGALSRLIPERRAQIEKLRGAAARIGLPLKPRADAPDLSPRRIELARTPLPPIPRTAIEPEIVISDAQFEDIIKTLRHAARTLETTPETFSSLQEEGLRDVIIANLTSVYPSTGRPTAEAFRKRGKTDILIESDSRAAFLAECKTWSGPASMDAAITQLLSYHIWRDCKSALILFNKHTAGFTRLLEAVESAVAHHANYVSSVRPFDSSTGEGRYLMRSLEDPGRRTEMHDALPRRSLRPPTLKNRARSIEHLRQ